MVERLHASLATHAAVAGDAATALADGVVKPADRRRGDHDLDPHLAPGDAAWIETPLRPASVLVPLIDHADGLSILLTQRTDHLTAHAGQISFPGGRREPGDADVVATALREAEEEIGLSPDRVRVIGRLDTYVTRTGFEVTPVVGIIDPPIELTLDDFEVAEAFEVPLSFVVDPANHERHGHELGGAMRHFYVLPYQQRYIWGATAGMLVNLAHLLAP